MTKVPVKAWFYRAYSMTAGREVIFLGCDNEKLRGIYMGDNLGEASHSLAEWNAYREQEGHPPIVITDAPQGVRR